MTDREKSPGQDKKQTDKKLTLDKEQLGDMEPEDADQVRGGVLPMSLAKANLSLPR